MHAPHKGAAGSQVLGDQAIQDGLRGRKLLLQEEKAHQELVVRQWQHNPSLRHVHNLPLTHTP